MMTLEIVDGDITRLRVDADEVREAYEFVPSARPDSSEENAG